MLLKFGLTLTSIAGLLLVGCDPTSSTEPIPVIAYNTASTSYIQSMAIVSDTVISTGGVVDSFTISPNVNTQTGLTFNKTTGAISGTPTLAHAATAYTVIARGPGGSDTSMVTLTVTALAAALEAHTWLLTGFLSHPGISLTGTGPKHVDVFDSGFTSPCDKHETEVFLSNGKLIDSHDSAATLSGCGLPDTSTWTLGGKVLTLIYGTGTDASTEKDTIVSISSTKLVESTFLSASDSPDDLSHTLTFTSTAK